MRDVEIIRAGVIILMLASVTQAAIRLPKIFSDKMVLQQQKDCAIWGWAAPGEQISVEFRGKQAKTVAGADSSWQVQLPSGSAGGPFELLIKEQQNLAVKNIMVGEVWICSGQSNMEMPLAGWGKINNYEQEIAAANYANIRLFTVPRAHSAELQKDVTGGNWQECNSQNIAEFSAVAYFFGRHVQQKLGVPVGLINTSWGGTPIEAWIGRGALNTIPDFAEFINEMDKIGWSAQKADERFEQELKLWEQDIFKKDRGFSDGKPTWALPEFDDRDWPRMALPQAWETAGLPDYNGAVWFRFDIDMPKEFKVDEAVLHLGAIDDWDITWFNGVEVGRLSIWNKPRDYRVAPELLLSGKNIIAIRVFDSYGYGGLWQAKPEEMFLEMKAAAVVKKLPLAGDWKYQPGVDYGDVQPAPSRPNVSSTPTFLFNAMVHPLGNFKMRGAIWYQGESNADRAYQYRALFPLMINDWRRLWNEGDFPFLFVQLANWRKAVNEPVESDWAELREAQLMTLAQKNTGMAVAVDIGDALDIHPSNKQDVGERLALAARKIAYGENILHSGPIYEKMQREGNKIRLFFKFSGCGLIAKGGDILQGFTIAGHNRKFVQGQAVIENNSVVVSSEVSADPVAVRYAWADNPQGCNLYNKEGLPASPFRTDDWPGITIKNK